MKLFNFMYCTLLWSKYWQICVVWHGQLLQHSSWLLLYCLSQCKFSLPLSCKTAIEEALFLASSATWGHDTSHLLSPLLYCRPQACANCKVDPSNWTGIKMRFCDENVALSTGGHLPPLKGNILSSFCVIPSKCKIQFWARNGCILLSFLWEGFVYPVPSSLGWGNAAVPLLVPLSCKKCLPFSRLQVSLILSTIPNY